MNISYDTHLTIRFTVAVLAFAAVVYSLSRIETKPKETILRVQIAPPPPVK